MSKKISAARLRTIYKRQINARWDESYIPSILATREEAPSKSWPTILTSKKISNRHIHLLSKPERNAALLGLYNPKIIGLQEQRMLNPEPDLHPLHTFVGVDRSTLCSFSGLISVAERLNCEDFLTRIKVKVKNDVLTMVFPLFGDLLWAVKNDVGDVFCINWSIKGKREQFLESQSKSKGNAGNQFHQDLLVRHQIEQVYYSDCDIRTTHISDEFIDSNVVANLRQLFLHHASEVNLNVEQHNEIASAYKTAMEIGIAPNSVIENFSTRRKYSVYQCRTIFYQLIWNRELRVDLFSPILINKPLNPEARDVLEVYADWFKEAS
ncbi:hypothetical protein [Methylotenera mobilis]|uniref:Uncharacterized protein n=1 Tax=Methylotenera mobilis (strain JLW8 / ATCC BAA-1282 / DSM 17540) TaxID=583345 RepID=C6WWS4_METML|nr:hypothetical protein [Methylotenera mobilis]ACT48373.1 conserved hypothetical protein [Methylotenera mobilis JLW8]